MALMGWQHKSGEPPNVFVIGAPKCGTTSIALWLAEHPDVVNLKAKEPGHYYSPFGRPLDRTAYLELYQHSGEELAAIDASVWYLYGRAAQRILDDRPEARFIVCLRDPVDMVPSLHSQKLLTGHEAISDLQEAWNVSDRRAAGERVGIFGIPEGDPGHMAYGHSCSLGAQVHDLLSVVDRDRVLFLTLDEISTTPADSWAKVLNHLDLRHTEIEFRAWNVSTTRRRSQAAHRAVLALGSVKRSLGLTTKTGLLAPLVRANLGQGTYQRPDERFGDQLREYFAADKALLHDLTGHAFD